jgi:aspartate aminotransferase
MRIARHIDAIGASATLAITAKAKEMKAQGKDVISLSAGEPDFDVPPPVAEGAIRAVREKRNGYTAVPGIPELRAAIADKLSRENGLQYAPEEILVSVGAKQAICNAVAALTEEGDEVLVPAPYWTSYPAMVALAKGKTVSVECRPEESFELPPERLKAACTDNTHLVIVNSPNNPTGAVYGEASLEGLAAVAREKDLFVISDEIYEKLVYGEKRHLSPVNVDPAMKERTLLVNGFSKVWGMPGWRLGYCAGPVDLIKAIGKIQGHSTSNAPSIAQYAALAALEAGDLPIEPVRTEFVKRRDYVLSRIDAVEGISAPVPDGAFYVLVDCRPLLPARLGDVEIADGTALALNLLEHGLVASVPGEAFESPGHVRFSYATSMENLTKALDRFEEFLGKLER